MQAAQNIDNTLLKKLSIAWIMLQVRQPTLLHSHKVHSIQAQHRRHLMRLVNSHCRPLRHV